METHNTILCHKDPILNNVLAGHRKPTTIPQKLSQSQNAHNSITTVPPHCPHKSSPHFLCGRSNSTSQPHPLHTLLAIPWHYCPHNHSGVVYLINCHDLTFDLLRRPLRHLAGSKVTLDRGHAHLSPCPGPHK